MLGAVQPGANAVFMGPEANIYEVLLGVTLNFTYHNYFDCRFSPSSAVLQRLDDLSCISSVRKEIYAR